VSLAELIEKYFRMMAAAPTLSDLSRFADEIPAHLQVSFLSWIRRRALALAEARRDDSSLN